MIAFVPGDLAASRTTTISVFHHALRGATDRLGARKRDPGGVLVPLDRRRALLLIYPRYPGKRVFITGQAFGLVVWVRDLYFTIINERQVPTDIS
jgi:hypothetical protein